MNYPPVPLNRTFSTVAETESDDYLAQAAMLMAGRAETGWEQLEKENRVVILAEAGAGKTFEMEARSTVLRNAGRQAFFIRIEDIDADFESAFEVGTEEDFSVWLKSADEGWFFLDSIDESRLDNPKAFEKAIKRFGNRILKALHRAHIIVSSRPYAWRDVSDRRLIQKFLPFGAHGRATENSNQATTNSEQGELRVFTLDPLSDLEIRKFASFRQTADVDRLMGELQRTNLAPLAARPFDLEGILAKWRTDRVLEGRLELLKHNVTLRLGEIDPDRRQRQPLRPERAIEGARRLAAAIVLTGESGISVPDIGADDTGIDAQAVLSDWEPTEINALLHRGLFNDPLYGIVRFRHREVRELLAAEWFNALLKRGSSRREVEGLIFRTKYGQTVIAPRLRPILPWLILFDHKVREKAVNLVPEIAVEGGDAAHLPLTERVSLLEDITERIADEVDDRSARENDAILRIAQSDLSETARSLLERYFANDDAVFFLARLVWQGEMSGCVALLLDIARDVSRGVYTRIASIRAVLATGTSDQKKDLWSHFATSETNISHRILDELLDGAGANSEAVATVLSILERLEPHKPFGGSGLSEALHDYIDRLEVDVTDPTECPLVSLVEGLHTFLSREPLIEKRDCRVSQANLWLIPHATHAIEKIVGHRSTYALSDVALAIMILEPAVRFWKSGVYSEYESNLASAVPKWAELNDALYWKSIEMARNPNGVDVPERVIDDWRVRMTGHFWRYGADRFEDVTRFITEKEHPDDKLVALSLAFRLYLETGKSERLLERLKETVKGQIDLEDALERFLNPVPSKMEQERQERYQQIEQERKARTAENEQARFDWIQALKSNPERVRAPVNIKPGQVTNDQIWLRLEIDEKSGRDCYASGANWRALIPEFGDDIAKAYRDAALEHWRNYSPVLGSEGASLGSTAHAEIFGLVGLSIEANINARFPENLTEEEAKTAARYVQSELNGFPEWYERLFIAWPELVTNLMGQELLWELATTSTETPKHYILHDITYYAPWSHAALSKTVYDWLMQNRIENEGTRRYVMRILLSSGVSNDELSALSQTQLNKTTDWREQAFWFAILIDVEVEIGLPRLHEWLRDIDEVDQSVAAQIFLGQLIGTRRSTDMGIRRESYRTVSHLLELYLLMHEFVRSEDDIHRANGGVYTPGLRDDAQEAREILFKMLSELRGKEVYVALCHLSEAHPVEQHRPWMRRQASQHARNAADIEAWSAEQVSDFDLSLMRSPNTHQQLFEIGVNRLIDLKDWLETGNDSPFRTWQKADDEAEIRNLIAGELNKTSQHHFTCAQENELANDQRPDIWLQATGVEPPVPIELKVLDKGWSGPKLCERLRNQLVGDYLREEEAKCGVFLLVWQGRAKEKTWRIGGKSVSLTELASALEAYWEGISDQFPGVEDIEVIVIDLTVRKFASQT